MVLESRNTEMNGTCITNVAIQMPNPRQEETRKTFVRSVPLLLLVLLFPASLAAQPETADVMTADFVAWTKENAIRLDSLEWSKTNPTAFAFLDEALKGKRVVFLGETDHFVAERLEFRLLLIRELARRGFRRIGMEMGLSDGKRMDRFLETGDEKWLDRVALYGYRGDMRKDRKDEIAGWTDDSHPEFTRTVLDESKWFLRQLRKIDEQLPKGTPRLKWFGYDLSFRPGGEDTRTPASCSPRTREPPWLAESRSAWPAFRVKAGLRKPRDWRRLSPCWTSAVTNS